MKKVLHLASWYPNKTSIQQGDFIQRHLQAISLYLPVQVIFVVKDLKNIKRGQKVETSINGNLKETIIYYHPIQTGISIADKIISRITYLKIYQKEIKKYILENGKPDLIHVHVAMRAGLAALLIKKKYKIPFIITEHWCGYFKSDIKGLYGSAKKLMHDTKKILKNSQAILPVSQVLKDAIREIYPHPNFHIIPNVVNENIFNFKFTEPKIFTFLHVSSMNYFKNAEGVFTAFDKFLKTNNNAVLICLGETDNHLKNWFEKNISQAGKLNIIFKGVINYENVADYMKQSHALIINSFFETFSCVSVEALSCGTPVISTPVGILPEIINEENGIIVNSNNELFEALQHLYKSSNNYNRHFIAEKNIGKYSYFNVGKKICGFYDLVLTK